MSNDLGRFANSTGVSPGMLVDSKGNPIPPGIERERAADLLQQFMDQNKKRFEEFWRANGFGVRPPIKYSLGRKEWMWLESEVPL